MSTSWVVCLPRQDCDKVHSQEWAFFMPTKFWMTTFQNMPVRAVHWLVTSQYILSGFTLRNIKTCESRLSML